MAQGSNHFTADVAKEPEELREDMQETRSALAEKLETLEERVLGTVEAAQSRVEETVDAVKEKVQDTVQSVKHAFDLRYQTEQHPWPMFGASVLAGFTLGMLLPSGPEAFGRARRRPGTNGAFAAPAYAAPPPAQPAQDGLLTKLTAQFGDEIGMLKRTAIGAIAGLARDWLKEAAPALAPQLEQMLNSATSKLGGEPVDGPVWQRSYAANRDGLA